MWIKDRKNLTIFWISGLRSCQPLSYTEELELNHLLDEFPEYTDYFEAIAALADSTMYVHDEQNLSVCRNQQRKKSSRISDRIMKDSQLYKYLKTFPSSKLAWAMTCLLAIGTSMSMIEFRNYETNYRNLPVKKAL